MIRFHLTASRSHECAASPNVATVGYTRGTMFLSTGEVLRDLATGHAIHPKPLFLGILF
jgi:hypothetical protein